MMYITSSKSTNIELAPLGLNLHTVEKMKDKALRNKQIIIRLTEDEHQQIKDAYETLHMSQSDYIRKQLFTASQPSFLDKREIHDVRVIGITLTKILEKLNDTQMSDDEIKETRQLITEIKMIVRRLNDTVSKS